MEVVWPENCHEMFWKVHRGIYLFYCPVDWVQIWGCWVHWHIFNEYLKGKLKKMILGGGGLTWKLSWNFQIKLFPPKNFFLYVFLVFFGYMLMCLTFSGLDSERRDVGLDVLFRTFRDNFWVKLFPPEVGFFNYFLSVR